MQRPMRELFPGLTHENSYGFCGPSDYDDFIPTLGYQILTHATSDGYSGDSLFLVHDGHRFGVLTFGWGSCSGCDSLQGCRSYQDLEDLRDDLDRGIIWQDSAEEMLAFLYIRDWETQFYSKELGIKFAGLARKALKGYTKVAYPIVLR